jgi:hypothetical protein
MISHHLMLQRAKRREMLLLLPAGADRSTATAVDVQDADTLTIW